MLLDFAAILLLWLPLEFAAGASLVARPAQGFLHSVAYGVAILLGLVLFIGFRSFAGLKYNLPRMPRDYRLPLAGFAVAGPGADGGGDGARLHPGAAPAHADGRPDGGRGRA